MQIEPIKDNKLNIKTIKNNKIIKVSIISFFAIFILYLGMSIYFSTHFYSNSVFNGINAFGKTVDQLDSEILSKSETYTLELTERNGIKEQIKAADIELKYNGKDKIQALKDSENSFAWIHALFNAKHTEIYGMVTYDEKLLKEHFDKLSFFDSKKAIEPENANFKYLDSGYVIVKEVMGNKVNTTPLYANIVSSILKEETTVNLEAKNYYINPKYTSSSKEVIRNKNLLNKYIASKITYTFTGGTKVLDGKLINNWIRINKDLVISFDEIKVKSYLAKTDDNYDSYGRDRNFLTSLGTNVKVSGGTYGWLVDRRGEVSDLIATIKKGQTVKKEPRYIQTAASHNVNNDIGKTYVEINMTEQHLWFYKNGNLIADGDVVTGNPNTNLATPAGVYSIQYKERNATLKGEGYSTPVNVFMPFNGNIGIHDASWKEEFGGSVYLTNGSHGCINSPPSLAQTIFDNIDDGTPVVCYL